MCRLICAFVVHIWHKQVFSWRSSNEYGSVGQMKGDRLSLVITYSCTQTVGKRIHQNQEFLMKSFITLRLWSLPRDVQACSYSRPNCFGQKYGHFSILYKQMDAFLENFDIIGKVTSVQNFWPCDVYSTGLTMWCIWHGQSFYGEINKIIPQLSPDTLLICSTGWYTKWNKSRMLKFIKIFAAFRMDRRLWRCGNKSKS